MNTLPPLTAEARASALEAAAAARKKRSDVKARVKAGALSLPEVLASARSDEVLAKMPVFDLLKSLPGLGDVRARQVMERLRIAGNRRIGGLGANQRAALENEFAPVAA